MSEQDQNTADDAQGHYRGRDDANPGQDNDVEGHTRARTPDEIDRDDDVEGHARHFN